MTQNVSPLVALDANGQAEVVSYDMPEPTAYSGRNYIDLQLGLLRGVDDVDDWFRHDAPAASSSRTTAVQRGPTTTDSGGTTDDQILARIVGAAGTLRIVHNADGTTAFDSNLPMSGKLQALTPQDVLRLEPGKQVVLRRSMYGTLTYSVISTGPVPAPLTPLSAGSSSPGSGASTRMATVPPETNPPSVDISWDSGGRDTSPKTFTSWPLAPVYGTAQPEIRTGKIQRLVLYLDASNQQIDILKDLNTRTWEWQTSQAEMGEFTPAPSNGQHTLHVEASGTGGGGGTSTAFLSFTLKLSGTGGGGPSPTLSVTKPKQADTVPFNSLPMPVSVAGSASSSSGIRSVEVELDGDPSTNTAAQPAGGSDWGSWTASLTVNAEGQHTITATCTDTAGNTTATKVTFVAKLTPLTVVSELKPRLLLVESYRLSSYLGVYGAGRVVKTFTLLPGESTTISVSTFNKIETTSKSASSILDSFSDQSATDFEDTLATEQHHEEAQKETFNYHVDAQANAVWGWGSAQLNAGVKGGTDSSRDEFGKTTTNALQKHSTEASAKRDVNVTSEYTATSDTEGQTKVERQIKNVNVSRVLNFVFRQMNQEFFTFLHLVDLRIAYYKEELMSDGSVATTYKEATLPELDALLQSVIAAGTCMWQAPAPAGLDFQTGQIEKWLAAKQLILQECIYVTDYQGTYKQILELAKGNDPLQRPYAYWRVKPGVTQTYTDSVSDQSFTVPGVIIRADSNVMRTEGIIVDALLGQGQALDDYSQGLQAAAVKQRDLANTQAQADIDKDQLAISIVTKKDDAAAKIYTQVYPPPEEEPELEIGVHGDGRVAASPGAADTTPQPSP